MPRRTIIFAILLILLSGAAVAIAAISENTGVAYGGTSTLTGPDGVCKKVTNNSPTGKQLYVPGSTPAEWQSFVSAAQNGQISGVTLGSCGCTLPWGGTLNDGQSVTAYQAASAPYGGCVSQTRRVRAECYRARTNTRAAPRVAVVRLSEGIAGTWALARRAVIRHAVRTAVRISPALMDTREREGRMPSASLS